MRTYSNYLLFEDILDNLPTSSGLLQQAASLLINPAVRIVEEDCDTLLGSVLDLTYELEGMIELATDLPLSRTRISQLLSSGQYNVRIRNLHSCISTGGICRKCYNASYIGETAESIGKLVSLLPKQIYQTDLISGNGIASTFNLSQGEDEYYFLVVIKNGVVYPDTNYTLALDKITFSTIPTITDFFTIHFYKETSEALLGYVSKTYSGGLLGIQPLPSLDLLIRKNLYNGVISDGLVPLMVEELHKYKTIPATFMQYIDKIQDKLEKVIFILLVYAVYGNIVI